MRIGKGDRVLMVGPTRSGKSTLATYFAGGWKHVLVYDPKGAGDPAALLPGAAVAWGVEAAARHLPAGRVIYRPLPHEHDDLAGNFARLLRRIMQGGGACGVVVHETEDVAPASHLPRWMSVAVREGAGQSVPMIFITQRPVWISRLVRSQAVGFGHVFLFGQHTRADLRTIADELAVDWRQLDRRLPTYAYLHRGPGGPIVACPPLRLTRESAPRSAG